MNSQTESFGLHRDVRQALSEIFEDIPEIEEVVIFGSRAKGNFTEGSDIDLAIKGSAVTFDTVLDLMDKADSLGLLYKIDIQGYHAITDKDVLEHIQRVGKVFWRRDVKVKV